MPFHEDKKQQYVDEQTKDGFGEAEAELEFAEAGEWFMHLNKHFYSNTTRYSFSTVGSGGQGGEWGRRAGGHTR